LYVLPLQKMLYLKRVLKPRLENDVLVTLDCHV